MTIYLSASLIKDYLECKKRADYRLHYEGESEKTPEMAIGTLVHTVLETNWNNKEGAIAEAKKLINSMNLESDAKLAFKCIENFFSMFPENYFSANDRIEKFFRVPYKPGVQLIGKMDRIHDGIIFDWKTGARPPANLDLDLQFVLYYIAYKKQFTKPPSNLAYVHLPYAKIYYFKKVDVIFAELENVIIPEIVKDIKNNNFPRNGLFAYNKCTRCPFKNTCWREFGLK